MSKIQFSVQVRLVSDLTRSKQFYEEVLGCEVNDVWAVRDDFALGFKLIQAESRADVTPNPAGKDHATRWDTYAYVGTHYDLDALYEELTSRGPKWHRNLYSWKRTGACGRILRFKIQTAT